MKFKNLSHKFDYWYGICNAVAQASPDLRTKVGCLIINYNTLSIITVGYNGFVRGAKDDILPKENHEKYKYIIHAEQNAICNSVLNGSIIPRFQSFAFTNISPCVNCSRYMLQCGIKYVIFKEVHHTFNQFKNTKDIGLVLDKENGYYIGEIVLK